MPPLSLSNEKTPHQMAWSVPTFSVFPQFPHINQELEKRWR